MSKNPATSSALFAEAPPRRRRLLILPRFLTEEADKQAHRDAGPDLDNARAILVKWAAMESQGLLRKKESALDANFLIDVFGAAFAPARADTLLTQTGERKKEVGESLRAHYVPYRAPLIANLRQAIPHDIEFGTFADNSRGRVSPVDILRHLANNELV